MPETKTRDDRQLLGARFLSTGKAARLCSVTPDAVLKWIKSGLLPAHRTAGGHYRIHLENLQRLFRVRELVTNILVVSNNKSLASSVKQDAELLLYRLEVTDCEYKCSALLEVFTPDYVVLDSSLGADVTANMYHHLVQDPRIPNVRLILAADKDQFSDGCGMDVFARIERPFGITDIIESIQSASFRWPATKGDNRYAGSQAGRTRDARQ